MIHNGWAGRRAVVNLRSREVSVETLSYDFLRRHVGGRALNVQVLADRTIAGLDPFNPDSPFCLATGPLAGANAPCASGLHLACRSPLTHPGTVGLSAVPGSAGPRMKLAGFDQVVVEGRSESPVFLVVADGDVTFHDANDIWGADAVRTQAEVQETVGDRSASVLSIGLAGENEVRFASLLADASWPADGLGFGAVWGAKRLKAIAFRATDVLRPCHAALLREKGRDVRHAFARHAGMRALARSGTLYPFEELRRLGLVPERNFTALPEAVPGLLGLDRYRREHQSGSVGCFSCPLHCGLHTAGEELSSRGIHFGGLNLDGALGISARLGLRRWFDVLRVYHACVRLGLDPAGFASLAGWLTDGYTRGLLDARRTGRILAWGEADQYLSLAETVARREGPGRYFGEGAFREAKRVGGGAERILAHTAGVDWPAVDPRADKGQGLAQATGWYAWSPVRTVACPSLSLQARFDPAVEAMQERNGGDDRAAAGSWKAKPALLAHGRVRECLAQMAGLCALPVSSVFGLSPADVAELLYAVTGEVYTSEGLVDAAVHTLEQEMALLLRDGCGVETLRPAERFFSESVPEGPFQGERIREEDFTQARGEYFQAVWSLKASEEGGP